MSRNTTTELSLVFDSDLTTPMLQAFLDSADTIVTNGPALSLRPALSAAELKEIEKYLAAHLASMRDPRELRHKTGDAEAWYYAPATTEWKTGFNLTPYGQQAVAMDRSGVLAGYGRAKGSFRASPREDGANFTRGLTKS